MAKSDFENIKSVLKAETEGIVSCEALIKAMGNLPFVEFDREESQDGKLIFCIVNEGNHYVFEYDPKFPPESTLFSSTIAQFLGITTVESELVELGSLKGLLSKKEYTPENSYIRSADLLEELSSEELKSNYLESVQSILKSRYGSRQDGETLIAGLMDKIARILVLNIVLEIPEFPSWQLQESRNGSVDIAPIEANAQIFGSSLRRIPLSTQEQQELLAQAKAKIKVLVDNIAHSHLDNHLLESLWVLKKGNMEKVFKKLRKEKSCEIKRLLEIKYSKLCCDQLVFLTNLLGIDELPVSKDVEWNTILAMSNSRHYSDGEIAISVITPRETHHATAIEGSFAHHENLFVDVYGRLYGQKPDNIRLSVIGIYHICYDSLDREAHVNVPYYITEYEYESLEKILVELSAHGVYILATHMNFDPINNCFRRGRDKEFKDLDILNYLKSNGFVVDYDWPFERVSLSEENREHKI